MLLELLRAGKVDSSGSNGVGRGEGKWMLVRSGREPPVLCVAGIRVVVLSWSADGKMLKKGERKKSHRSVEISAWADLYKISCKKGDAHTETLTGLPNYKMRHGSQGDTSSSFGLFYICSTFKQPKAVAENSNVQGTTFFPKDLSAL